MLMREATTAIDCVTRLARLELATVEIGLRLWRQWIDVGGTLAEDLNRIGLATPRSVAGPALGGADTALQATFRRFFGQLSQVPFQVAMQFLLEATELMYQRFLLEQVWERVGIDVEAGKRYASTNPLMIIFRQMLFSKIVPNVNKLGLMTDRVRARFEELQVIQYADAPDSATEALAS